MLSGSAGRAPPISTRSRIRVPTRSWTSGSGEPAPSWSWARLGTTIRLTAGTAATARRLVGGSPDEPLNTRPTVGCLQARLQAPRLRSALKSLHRHQLPRPPGFGGTYSPPVVPVQARDRIRRTADVVSCTLAAPQNVHVVGHASRGSPKNELAPRAGLEPATIRLTAGCSTN